MADQADIEKLVQILCEAHPQESLKKMDKTSEGLGAVLRFLGRKDEPVTAGEIAQAMQVSTARIAVILKKLEAKGLIIRQPGQKDARTTVVSLSEEGQASVDEMKNEVYRLLGSLIDQLGLDRMLTFAEISKEIHTAIKGMEKPKDHFEKV